MGCFYHSMCNLVKIVVETVKGGELLAGFYSNVYMFILHMALPSRCLMYAWFLSSPQYKVVDYCMENLLQILQRKSLQGW